MAMPNPQNVISAKLPLPLKGMNCVRPPHEIDNQESRDCMNFWISPFGQFETRPGLVSMLTSAIGKPIKGCTYHPASDKYILFAGTKVYSVGTSGGAVAEIGTTNALSDGTTVSMCLFHGDVYLATGGALQRVKLSDGSLALETVVAQTYSLVPPTAAGSAIVRNSRLWVGERAGSKVWYSGTDDGLDWGRDPDAGSGNGETLNGGYLSVDSDDGGSIAGFANFKDSLIIFKTGRRSSIHKITSDPADASSFSRIQISEGVSALGSNLICHIDTDVLYCGNGGVFSLQVTDYVGSVASVPVSLKANSYYETATPQSASFSPELGMMFVVLGGANVLVYHRGAEAWFRWVFNISDTVSSVSAAGGAVLFGTASGQLYRLDRTVYTDGGAGYLSSFVSKAFDFGDPIRRHWVKSLFFALQTFTAGSAFVDVRGNFGSDYIDTISVDGVNSYSSMWDSTGWDHSNSRWDSEGFVNVQTRSGKVVDNLQYALTTTGAVRVLEMGVYGVHLSKRRWRGYV